MGEDSVPGVMSEAGARSLANLKFMLNVAPKVTSTWKDREHRDAWEAACKAVTECPDCLVQRRELCAPHYAQLERAKGNQADNFRQKAGIPEDGPDVV